MKLDIAELKKRLQPRSLLALTLEPRRLVGTLVRREAAGPAETAALPIGAEELLKDPAGAGAELRVALNVAGIRERRCAICVPPSWALTASTDLPEVGAEDLRGYLELRAEREFSIAAADLRFGYSAYRLPDGKRRATLAALSARRIEAVEKMLESAGCRAVSLSLALNGCMESGAGEEAMLHLLATEGQVDVALTAGGGIIGLRTLPVGSPFDAAAFCREIRITLGRLPEGMRNHGLRARFGGMPELARSLHLAVRTGFERMGVVCTLAEMPSDGGSVQAARCALLQKPVPFEFIVPKVNRFEETFTRFDSQRRRRAVLAAVGAILLLILAALYRSHEESSLQAEWDGMKGNVAELDALQGKIRRFRPWFEPTPVGVQVLESLVSAFPDGGDAWAKSVQEAAVPPESGGGYKITCTVFARNKEAWLALLDRLRARPDITAVQVQQFRGDNPVQFSLTYNWKPEHEG